MATKRVLNTDIVAARMNSTGQPVGTVRVYVYEINGQVYIDYVGEKSTNRFAMSVGAWNALKSI